ncbi:MAG TPA: flavin reductase family protein [Gemmatimonadales bacterium]|nr:flavin reductase family protein [Gemmatimonadales bacterium]
MDYSVAQKLLEHFPYGLYVVTVRADGEEHGMTANWITQASVDPPMIAVSIENTSKTIGLIRDAHHFAVSLLTTEQGELAGKLGRTSEQAPQKLKGVKTKPAPRAQTPVLTEALGWVECRAVASLPAGDHTMVLGEILEAGVENADATPLTLKEAGLKYG